MAQDEVARALWAEHGLQVSVAVTTAASREAARLHQLKWASASLLAQALTGGALLASLQKGDHRVNLQVECDGPLRGLFVDASADGEVRGYAKNPLVDVELGEGPYRFRPALGNSGFLSVLRDIGGEYYRSSVQLSAMRLAEDLNHYFVTSDQVATRVALEVRRDEAQSLGAVAGVLVQAMPDGDASALDRLDPDLPERLQRALTLVDQPDAEALLTALFPEASLTPMVRYPVRWKCQCSKERVEQVVSTLGEAEVRSLVEEGTGTSLTCQFCSAVHALSVEDLKGVLVKLTTPVVQA